MNINKGIWNSTHNIFNSKNLREINVFLFIYAFIFALSS